jgi:hypothetical protein
VATNNIHQINNDLMVNARQKCKVVERKVEVEKQKCIVMEKQLQLYGIDPLGSALASGMRPLVPNFTSTVSHVK